MSEIISRKGAKLRYFGDFVTWRASTQCLSGCFASPGVHKEKRSACAKKLQINMQEQMKIKL